MAGKRKRAATETMRLWFAIMKPSGMTISPALDPVAKLAPDGRHRLHQIYRVTACFRIVYDANTGEVWDNFLEQLQPLATYFKLKRCKPSNVAPRMRQTRNKSLPHRIVYNQENDWCFVVS